MKARTALFRNYDKSQGKVQATYQTMQENQTLAFVKQMKDTYASSKGYRNAAGEKIRKPFAEAFAELDNLIDDSDPDTDLPQVYHAYQTGEALRAYLQPEHPQKLREDIVVRNLFTDQEWRGLPLRMKLKYAKANLHELYPHITDWSWLPLVGFLHDSGKVMATKAWGELPQWAVVGDTFPVGAPFSPANVYAEYGFFKSNPDLNLKNNRLTKFGLYSRHCGLDHVDMSWGHDEYFYSVLHRTHNILPEEALYIIRFHSFYPWHTPRNGERGYTELAGKTDWLRLPLLKAFQQSDLYSKKAEMPDREQLKAYYTALLERYLPGRDSRPLKIKW